MKKLLLIIATSISVKAASITGCHFHGATYFCVDSDGDEGWVTPAPTATSPPTKYTDCSERGSLTVCFDGSSEVGFVEADDDDDTHDHDHESDDDSHSHEHGGHITSAAAQSAAVTGCHFHGSTLYCVDSDGDEGYISPAPSGTEDAPSSFTGCHAHGDSTYCLDGDNEFQFVDDSDDEDHHDHGGASHGSTSSNSTSNLMELSEGSISSLGTQSVDETTSASLESLVAAQDASSTSTQNGGSSIKSSFGFMLLPLVGFL